MARSEQSKQECETIIRWDATGNPAILWTLSVKVRNDWQAYGFPVRVDGTGWRTEIPVDRISYKTLRKV